MPAGQVSVQSSSPLGYLVTKKPEAHLRHTLEEEQSRQFSWQGMHW